MDSLSKDLSGLVSERAQAIQPFLAMELMERAGQLERAGRSIVHLDVGEPDFLTPEPVLEAGVRALRDGHTHYTHSMGHLELREAIADWYLRRYQVTVSPDRILVTLGSSAAMLLVFIALLNPGDEVLMSDPHYACYPKFVQAAGGTPKVLRLTEKDGFQLDPEQVRSSIGPKTKSVLLNSPSNPTGVIIKPDALAALSSAIPASTLIVSDEIYHGLEYKGRAASILEFRADAIVTNGFSKLFAMTGWRLGYAILPAWLVRPVQRLQQNLLISASDFVQQAAITALQNTGSTLQTVVPEYDRRRIYLLKRIRSLGFEMGYEPEGAFYCFLNVERYTQDVFQFCLDLLTEAGVALVPGTDFGQVGRHYVRISYANSLDEIEKGMDRFSDFLSLKKKKQGTS